MKNWIIIGIALVAILGTFSFLVHEHKNKNAIVASASTGVKNSTTPTPTSIPIINSYINKKIHIAVSPTITPTPTQVPISVPTPTIKPNPTTSSQQYFIIPSPTQSTQNSGSQTLQQASSQIDAANKQACDDMTAKRDAQEAPLIAQANSLQQQISNIDSQISQLQNGSGGGGYASAGQVDAAINSRLLPQLNSLTSQYNLIEQQIQQINSQYQCIYINPYK